MAERVWTVRDALGWTTGHFERASVPQPRLNAERLLSAATGLSRVELYTHHDRPLTAEERAAYRALVGRRAAGEPLQYVTGEVAFRHLVLRVAPGVFIPRPETEVLVDVALESLRGVESPLVADLCTGSGAVALSVAQEAVGARVWATEASPPAAAAARANAERLGLGERVTVIGGDLFAPLPADLRGRLSLVVANPPYVPSAELPDLPAEVRAFEPSLALDGGHDGLDVARRIIGEAREWLAPGGALVMELAEGNVRGAAQLMGEWYEGTEVRKDLPGRDRIATGRTRRAGQPT